MIMSTSVSSLPATAAANYYQRKWFDPMGVLALSWQILAGLSIACVRPIPLLNRGLPQIQAIPDTIVGIDKVAIVTGSNTGIGYETVKGLVARGYHVVMACRSPDKAQSALQQLQAELPNAPGKVVLEGSLDLASYQSVLEFSDRIHQKYDKIDLLVNNAGRNSDATGSSPEGNINLETVFKINYLSHFLLTNKLMELLLKAKKPRVVNISSVMHHFCAAPNNQHDETYWKSNALFDNPQSAKSYSASKLAALLHALALNQRYGKQGLRALAVNPGSVNSDIWRDDSDRKKQFMAMIFLNTQQGALPSLAASVLDDASLPDNVLYLQPYHQLSRHTPFPALEMMGPFVGYQAVRPRLPNDGSNGELTAQILWKVSEELTQTGNIDKKNN